MARPCGAIASAGPSAARSTASACASSARATSGRGRPRPRGSFASRCARDADGGARGSLMAPVRERSRARAEQVLDREYDTLRADTLRGLRGKLAASGGASFDDTDLEAFYNQAWHGLYLRLAEGED